MKGPEGRGRVGLGFSQFRENFCPTCRETFQTEPDDKPTTCRYCGAVMPKTLLSPVGDIGNPDYRKKSRAIHQQPKKKT